MNRVFLITFIFFSFSYLTLPNIYLLLGKKYSKLILLEQIFLSLPKKQT